MEYSSYILYLESVCENDAFDYINVFSLGNITKSSGLNDENDKLPKIETTIPLIETSQPFIEVSTIISTKITIQPLTTIQNIITTILTTIPNIISTTLTTVPNIITTEPETSIPKIISTQLETNEEIFTQPQIITTISQEKQNIDVNIESNCKDIGKIYYNGSCICDIDNGYYSLNHILSTNKCYKKNELPKNSYFNKYSQSNELCFKTCATCKEGGNILSHNCLTCSSNYIMDNENNSSNCVDNCKYYFYYDSFNYYCIY